MKRVLIIGFFLSFALLSFQKEETKEKGLTTAEKIARDVQRELGAFDEVYSDNDSLAIVYSYRDEANKTHKVKAAIDKTLNIVGQEVTPKNFLDPSYNYEWQTPTETIALRAASNGSNSYVSIWIYTK